MKGIIDIKQGALIAYAEPERLVRDDQETLLDMVGFELIQNGDAKKGERINTYA